MANQGGSHEQHVKAGQQSHKNSDTQKAASKNDQQASAKASATGKDAQSGKGTQGGSHEQHVNAGKQSHKNSH